MGKIDLEVFEDKFLKKHSIYYELSILIGVDSLCYSIFDNFQQLLGLRKYSYSQPLASFRDLPGPVSEILGADPFVNRSFAKVRLSLLHPYVALIPNRLYNEKEEKSYLEKMLRVEPDDCYFSDELPFADAMAVYPVPRELQERLKTQFPGAGICHGNSAISKFFSTYMASEAPHRMFFNLRDGALQVFAFENDDLLFMNSFPFMESTDLVYYLMLVLQQLSWKPEDISVWGSGLLVEDSAIFRNLQRYFPYFQFLTLPPQLYRFGPRFEKNARKHWFVDLFSISNFS